MPAQAEKLSKSRHHHGVHKQANHDRRGRQQNVIHKPRGTWPATPGRPYSARYTPASTPIGVPTKVASGHQHQRAKNGVGQPPGIVGRWGHLGKQGQAQTAHAQANGFPQNPDQPEHAKQHGGHRQGQGQLVEALALLVLGLACLGLRSRLQQVAGSRRAHVFAPSDFCKRLSSSLDSASTTKVMKNSTSPR